MSFMQPVVYETDYLIVEGPSCTECIPADVTAFEPGPEMHQEAEVTESDPPGRWVSVCFPRGSYPVPPELADYCENRTCYSIEKGHGWVGRMSAPGYLDCTDWVWGESEKAVTEELQEYHGCPECGEFEDDCTCDEENDADDENEEE